MGACTGPPSIRLARRFLFPPTIYAKPNSSILASECLPLWRSLRSAIAWRAKYEWKGDTLPEPVATECQLGRGRPQDRYNRTGEPQPGLGYLC